MPGCFKYGAGWLVSIGMATVLLAGPVRAREGDKPDLRIGVMIAAQDVFSRRAAGMIEHLGAQRIERAEGFEIVYPEEEEESTGSRAKYETALKQLKQGQLDYENLELDKAVKELNAAADQFEKNPVELLRAKENSYVSALTFLAAAYILTGDLPAGQAAFRRMLVSDRRAKLNKTLFPPSMVKTFEGVRQKVLRGPVGSLSVVSVPSHGKVFIDRVFKCITPCTVDSLPAGKHLVVIRKAGHRTWGGQAEVEEGGEQQVRCMLQRLDTAQKTVEAAQLASAEIEDDEPLDLNLQEQVREAGLDRLILGKLLQRGDGLAYSLALYNIASGKVVNFHEGTLQEGSAGFARSVDGLFSYLVTGRKDLLQTEKTVALRDDDLRLKDEKRFDEAPGDPVYKTWWFWTAIGVAAGAITVSVILLLPTSEEPQSQILLEF